MKKKKDNDVNDIRGLIINATTSMKQNHNFRKLKLLNKFKFWGK